MQIDHAKRNEEENINIPDPVYSCNNGEGEIVRRLLTNCIHAILPGTEV